MKNSNDCVDIYLNPWLVGITGIQVNQVLFLCVTPPFFSHNLLLEPCWYTLCTQCKIKCNYWMEFKPFSWLYFHFYKMFIFCILAHFTFGALGKLGRRALIGFCSSAVSDTCSNSIRVLKVYKQSHPDQLTYVQCLQNAVKESGVSGLMFRG